MRIYILHQDKFTKKEIDYLYFLGKNQDFVDFVEYIRSKVLGFPKSGLKTDIKLHKLGKIKIDPAQGKFLDSKSLSEITRYTGWIVSAFHLPYSWENTISTIILFNIALPPLDTPEYQSTEIKYFGSTFQFGSPFPKYDEKFRATDLKSHMVIIIREKFTFKSLLEQLRKEKNIIDKYLSYLPEKPSIGLEDIEIKKTILSLEEHGKSDKEIGEELDKKYGENKIPFSTDYNTVSRYKSRILDAIKELRKNKYITPDFVKDLDKHIASDTHS